MARSCVFRVCGLCSLRGVSDTSPNTIQMKAITFSETLAYKSGLCIPLLWKHSRFPFQSMKNVMQTLNIVDVTASVSVARRNAVQNRYAFCPGSKDKQ